MKKWFYFAVGFTFISGGFLSAQYSISGTVWEDISGDGICGDTVVNDTTGDNRALSNVYVALYRDDGSGVPDIGDNFVASATTNSMGYYSFSGLSNGLYWVVVDSKTVTPNYLCNGGSCPSYLWAEQTWGGVGTYCSNWDFGFPGPDPYIRSAPGPCYGGKNGDFADAFSTGGGVGNAEHIAKVYISSSDVTGVDFGFSFSVVTNTNLQGQGSLRQYVRNADNITERQISKFVPATSNGMVTTGGGDRYWVITPTSGVSWTVGGKDAAFVFSVEEIPGNTIDGTAYRYYNPDVNGCIVEEDYNPGTVGTTYIVPHPELGIDLTQMTVGSYGIVSMGKVDSIDEVYNIAIWGAKGTPTNTSAALVSTGMGNLAVDRVLVGLTPDGQDPGPGNRNERAGVLARAPLSFYSGLFVSNSYFAYNGIAALATDSATLTISNSEFIDNGPATSSNSADGDTIYYGIDSNGDVTNVIIHNTSMAGSPSPSCCKGIEIDNLGSGPGGGFINVYIADVQINNSPTAGIGIYGDSSGVDIRNTSIKNTTNGPGILLQKDSSGNFPAYINIQVGNSFENNFGPAIDISDVAGAIGNGVTPNDGLISFSIPNLGVDYPILTMADIQGGDLYIEGYIGSNLAGSYLSGNVNIHVYEALPSGFGDYGEVEAGDGQFVAHGEGNRYVGSCNVTLGANGSFSCTILGVSPDLVKNEPVTAIACWDDGVGLHCSEFGNNFVTTPVTLLSIEVE